MALYHGKNKIKNVGIKFKVEGGGTTADATITSGSQLLSGVTAYGATGKVTGTIPSQTGKTITPNDSIQTAIAAGTYAAGDVTVSAVPTETKKITENGIYTPQNGKYFSSINVSIAGENFETQSKTVSPTESQQTVTPDDGYDGLSSVTVGAVPADYVGTGVARQTATAITPTKSSQTVVSAGTYVSGAVTVDPIPSEYITTSDATAVAADIATGKTAYVNGALVTGTFTVENLDSEIAEQDEAIVAQDSIISQIQTALQGKASGNSGIDTSDATASASDIATGKTAYVNGEKITGTHACSASGQSGSATVTLRVGAGNNVKCFWYSTGALYAEDCYGSFYDEEYTYSVDIGSHFILIVVGHYDSSVSGCTTLLSEAGTSTIYAYKVITEDTLFDI